MGLAWLAPTLCAITFLLIVIFGSGLPRRGSFLAPMALLAGFVIFWFVLADLLDSGGSTMSIGWLVAGDVRLTWGMIVDPLSVTMLGLVTVVALGVQVYSLGYMAGSPRLGWYFAVHSLFAAAMLALVLADNLLFLYIAWELVGACSYLLIGFWYERRSAAEAAKKAFITTRVGDVGLLIGILLLFRETGSFELANIFRAAEYGGISEGILITSTLLLFLGAVGKSAQFPLHIWLPDAMEGPTPVSALIHAATMVVAGVYLVARMFPLFELAAGVLPVVATIGIITALMAATMALVQTDLKRILAYSTISHLGFMMLALGVGGFTAAMFHLVVHAFAKALLFLSAGSVDHAIHTMDIRMMGGLRRRLPITAFCFGVGALALGGLPPLSGFFSKDAVLLAVLDGSNPIFLVLTFLAVFLSALYMARALFVVFHGRLKDEYQDIRESPPVMVGPMLIFSVLALGIGFLVFPVAGLGFEGFGAFLYFGHPEGFHFVAWLGVVSVLLAALGFGFGWLAYIKGVLSPVHLQERFVWWHRLWERKYYLDDLYQWIIDRVVLVVGEMVAMFDRIIINDIGVHGTAQLVVRTGVKLRYHVSGRIYNYALGMVLGLLVLVVAWWLVKG